MISERTLSGQSGALLLWSTSPSPAEATAITIARFRKHRVTVEPLKLVVLQTPLETPNEANVSKLSDHFSGHGVDVDVSDPGLQTRADAYDPDVVAAIRGADLVFISGGQPTRMIETIRDTPALAAFCDASNDGAVVGGCSAGAMIFGAGMLDGSPDSHRPTPLLEWLPGIIIAPHYGNYPIAPWRKAYPDCTFLCLPDRSAALVTHNRSRITSVGDVPALIIDRLTDSTRHLSLGTSLDLS